MNPGSPVRPSVREFPWLDAREDYNDHTWTQVRNQLWNRVSIPALRHGGTQEWTQITDQSPIVVFLRGLLIDP
jgi:hypothetical protein